MNYLSQKVVIAVASPVTGKETKPSVVLILWWPVLLPCAPPPCPWGRKTVPPVSAHCGRDLPLPHLSPRVSPGRCSAIRPQAISSCRRSNLGGRQTLRGAGGGTRSHPLTLKFQELADQCLSGTSEVGGVTCEHMGLEGLIFFLYQVLLYLCVGNLRDFQLSSAECSPIQLP